MQNPLAHGMEGTADRRDMFGLAKVVVGVLKSWCDGKMKAKRIEGMKHVSKYVFAFLTHIHNISTVGESTKSLPVCGIRGEQLGFLL